ncbi:MAG: N-acetylneuraminate epimerase [Methanomassiliicoccales archaeon PtaB.Bin215]|nr:MAG: N-acetylneuraminate epimerase [Methanomassiliicoccales archaeon PtaB.Bin215]
MIQVKARLLVLTLAMMMALSMIALVPGVQAAEADWVYEGDNPGEAISYAEARLPDGRIFFSMGYNFTEAELQNDTWLLDPETMEWTRAADSPNATEATGAVGMPDGKVYLFGGAGGGKYLRDVLIYDPEVDQWSYGPALPQDLLFIRGVAVDDTTIMLAGGATDFGTASVLGNCYLYDIVTGEFTTISSMPQPRALGGIALYSGAVYYFGGFDSSGDGTSEVFVYDIESDSWYSVTYLPQPMTAMGVTVLVDGSMVILGGGSGVWWYDAALQEAYLFSPQTNLFTELPKLPEPVRNAGVYELDDGRIIYLYGINGTTPNKAVHSLLMWEMDAQLISSEVEQGGTTWMSIRVHFNFQDVDGLYGTLYLVRDNLTYGAYEFSSSGGDGVMVEMAISEMLPVGDYQVIFSEVRMVKYWYQALPFEAKVLTVTDAPTTQESLDELGDQNQALQDKLDELELQNQDLSDQLDALEQQNDELANDLAELKEANDAKMDAIIGYVILILVAVTMVVGVVILVRKK